MSETTVWGISFTAGADVVHADGTVNDDPPKDAPVQDDEKDGEPE